MGLFQQIKLSVFAAKMQDRLERAITAAMASDPMQAKRASAFYRALYADGHTATPLKFATELVALTGSTGNEAFVQFAVGRYLHLIINHAKQFAAERAPDWRLDEMIGDLESVREHLPATPGAKPTFLSRKKEDPIERKYAVLGEIVATVLGLQRVMTPTFALVTGSVINKGAVGYVYGLIDAAAQGMGLEMHNEWGDTLLVCAFDSMQEGSGKFLRPMLPVLQRDQAYLSGVFQGGSEFQAWANDKNVRPLGLLKLGVVDNSGQAA